LAKLVRGRKEGKVSPEAYQSIMLDEIAGRLADITQVQTQILEHIKETTPDGVDFPISDVTVTGATVVNFVKEYPYRKIRSLDPVFNKGSNTAYIRVNEEAKEIPVENRESLSISRPKATIEYITIRVASGESATIRMIGHF